jgi:uncharacterized membrane protein YbhN (UPF0104 family)
MANSEGSFVRWQTTALTQLGYVSNLILSFATASLGFSLTMVRDDHYQPNGAAKALWIVGVALLAASVALGIWCALNRLADFRGTAQNAKERERLYLDGIQDQLSRCEKQRMRTRLECRRLRTDLLGERTRLLLYLQITAFGIGALVLISAFATAFQGKIL